MRCASPPESVVACWPILNVGEADARQRLKLVADRGHRLEEVRAFLHRHVEHVGDGLFLEGDRRASRGYSVCLCIPRTSRIRRAGSAFRSSSTPSPWHFSQRPPLTLKEKRPGLIAARLAFGQPCEPFADRRERAGIGCRVRARRAPDGALVDVDDLVEVSRCRSCLSCSPGCSFALLSLRATALKMRVDEQRGFAAARNAGDAGEQANRNGGGDVLQIVRPRAGDGEQPSAASRGRRLRGTDDLAAFRSGIGR